MPVAASYYTYLSIQPELDGTIQNWLNAFYEDKYLFFITGSYLAVNKESMSGADDADDAQLGVCANDAACTCAAAAFEHYTYLPIQPELDGTIQNWLNAFYWIKY